MHADCRDAPRELSARQGSAGALPTRSTLRACAACADHAFIRVRRALLITGRAVRAARARKIRKIRTSTTRPLL